MNCYNPKTNPQLSNGKKKNQVSRGATLTKCVLLSHGTCMTPAVCDSSKGAYVSRQVH